ncbi:hypothetical protein E3V33_04785 [Candidatus Marinimicrobia bacterium MT.SAG.4]|nr:hypothetical protein E3V33_04785 [Candidatus Marinimicrobia bacterium MT.SAG.4]
MSSLYKRTNSPYYWWTTYHKGRKLYKSTGMTQKHLAKKVQNHWDLNIALGDFNFLGRMGYSSMHVGDYIRQYLYFIEERKSGNTLLITKGVLSKFQIYLEMLRVKLLEEISVTVLDKYINQLKCAPKTKKNHIGIISLMLEQAIKEDVIQVNSAKRVTLPRILKKQRHRVFEPIDLEIIFRNAGGWHLYYSLLNLTGLRAGDVAMLCHGNIDYKKKAIVSFIRKSRRIHELPLAESLIRQISSGKTDSTPLFPNIYSESERKLNDNLLKPRSYLQTLLEANGRPKATLHSFRVTFNNTLRDMGLSIEDRQILLTHSSSETTKIYTHPNFELAAEYVNKLPVYGKSEFN